jgi:hypothetical protein
MADFLYPQHLIDLLGKTFYAAAKADGIIKTEEIERFVSMITEEWHEDSGITKSFFHCVNIGYNDHLIFDEIKAHVMMYPEFFGEEMTEKIIRTAYKIVASYAKTNKSEIVFISRLRKTLKP